MARSLMRKIRRDGGFTLIEMMIVVAIIAALAAVAIVAYTRHIRSSRLVEAYNMVAKVQALQENYFRNYGTYCNASTSSKKCSEAGSTVTFHPSNTNNQLELKAWNPGSTVPGFGVNQLGMATVDKGSTYFNYASPAGIGPTYALFGDASTTGCAANVPWYYVKARADMDNSGGACLAASKNCTEVWVSSVRREVVVVNRGK